MGFSLLSQAVCYNHSSFSLLAIDYLLKKNKLEFTDISFQFILCWYCLLFSLMISRTTLFQVFVLWLSCQGAVSSVHFPAVLVVTPSNFRWWQHSASLFMPRDCLVRQLHQPTAFSHTKSSFAGQHHYLQAMALFMVSISLFHGYLRMCGKIHVRPWTHQPICFSLLVYSCFWQYV